jgi:hypothetical protein
VYISQLIWDARACLAYEDFSKRGKLKKKLMLQCNDESRLKSSFRKWPFLRLQSITGPYAEWFVSYNLLDCHLHTGFDNG